MEEQPWQTVHARAHTEAYHLEDETIPRCSGGTRDDMWAWEGLESEMGGSAEKRGPERRKEIGAKKSIGCVQGKDTAQQIASSNSSACRKSR